jgi:hypothetical protein
MVPYKVYTLPGCVNPALKGKSRVPYFCFNPSPLFDLKVKVNRFGFFLFRVGPAHMYLLDLLLPLGGPRPHVFISVLYKCNAISSGS